MKTIDIKKLLVLVVLLALCGVLAAGSYLYIIPEVDKKESRYSTLRSQVSSKQAEIRQLREDFSQIQELLAFFENLKASGFVSDQNRVVARQRLQQIKDKSGVLVANYEIEPAVVEKNENAERAGYVILNSPIRVRLEALDDRDIFRFIYWLENAYPGHISVRRMDMSRQLDVNDRTLRAIGSGRALVMVRSNIDLEWRSLLSQADIDSYQEGQNNEF